MEKNWFIIRDREHIGPFTADDLYLFYQENKINLETPIWKSGMPKPVAYRLIGDYDDVSIEAKYIENEVEYQENVNEDEIESLLSEDVEEVIEAAPEELDLPPPLPPQAQDPVIVEKKKNNSSSVPKDEIEEALLIEKRQEIASQVQEYLSNEISTSKQTPAVDMSKLAQNQVESNEVTYDDLSSDEVVEKTKFNFYRYLKFSIFFILFFVSVKIGKEIYSVYFKTPSRPEKMSLKEFETLKRLLTFKEPEKSFHFVSSKDLEKLWIGINFAYEGKVLLEMKSISDKILSSSPIIFNSSSYLENKIVEFNQLNFESGTQIVPGYYQMTFKLLHKKIGDFWLDKFLKFDQTFEINREVYIGPNSEEMFEKELIEYLQRSKNTDRVHWIDLSQKFETLKQITNKIYEEILSAVEIIEKNPNTENVIASFEQNYRSNYGVFLSSFVVENQQIFEQLKTNNTSDRLALISGFEKLYQLSKQLGETCMEATIKFSDAQTNPQSVSKEVRDNILKKLTDIELESKNQQNLATQNFN